MAISLSFIDIYREHGTTGSFAFGSIYLPALGQDMCKLQVRNDPVYGVWILSGLILNRTRKVVINGFTSHRIGADVLAEMRRRPPKVWAMCALLELTGL